MTKKIIKISLSIIAVFGFLLSAWKTVTDFSPNVLYNSVISNGMSISPPQMKMYNTHSAAIKPYSYINLQKTDYLPLALSIYDQIASEQEQGQDSPQPTPTPPPSEDDPPAVFPILPEGVYPISAIDMSEKQSANNLTYKNESKYTPDINELTKKEYPLKYSMATSLTPDTSPIVLIIHTHGTECYTPDNTSTYTNETPTRTTDVNNNVVAVGKVFAETLRQNGIPTIHCETMFDAESYSDSYNLSEKAVKTKRCGF